MVLDTVKYQHISEKTIDDIKMVESKSEVTTRTGSTEVTWV